MPTTNCDAVVEDARFWIGRRGGGCDAVDIYVVRKDEERVDVAEDAIKTLHPVDGPIRLFYPREMRQIFLVVRQLDVCA